MSRGVSINKFESLFIKIWKMSFLGIMVFSLIGCSQEKEVYESANQRIQESDEPLISSETLQLLRTEDDRAASSFIESGDIDGPLTEDQTLKYAQMAPVVLVVDKASADSGSPTAQTMRVYVVGDFFASFKVSTGNERTIKTKKGYRRIKVTPPGFFRPTRLYKEYQSRLYKGAQMNNAIFFEDARGIAIHATTKSHFDELGTRASGACVRMHPDDAVVVQDLVLTTGNREPGTLQTQRFTIPSQSGEPISMKWVRILGTSRQVPAVDRVTGEISKENTSKSWDTLIVVQDFSTLP